MNSDIWPYQNSRMQQKYGGLETAIDQLLDLCYLLPELIATAIHSSYIAEADVFSIQTAIVSFNRLDCGQFSPQGMKNLHSGEGVTWKCKLSSAEPCYSNDDDKDHPSREVEGSLLHSLYLQLLAVGAEGITLRKLYTSFATQTSVHRHGSSWRDKVREHLKTNPYFVEVKGRYLLCEQLVQSTSKRHIKRNNDIPCGVKSNDPVGEPGNSEGISWVFHPWLSSLFYGGLICYLRKSCRLLLTC